MEVKKEKHPWWIAHHEKQVLAQDSGEQNDGSKSYCAVNFFKKKKSGLMSEKL